MTKTQVEYNRASIAHVAVSYSDPRNGWYVQLVDEQGNQIGEAEYTYRCRDAMYAAAELAAEHGCAVIGYTRTGKRRA